MREVVRAAYGKTQEVQQQLDELLEKRVSFSFFEEVVAANVIRHGCSGLRITSDRSEILDDLWRSTCYISVDVT